jgi:hypothetical protein
MVPSHWRDLFSWRGYIGVPNLFGSCALFLQQVEDSGILTFLNPLFPEMIIHLSTHQIIAVSGLSASTRSSCVNWSSGIRLAIGVEPDRGCAIIPILAAQRHHIGSEKADDRPTPIRFIFNPLWCSPGNHKRDLSGVGTRGRRRAS